MEKSVADLGKGAIAGVVAGIVASWVMEAFQAAWLKDQSDPSSDEDPATVKAAQEVSKAATGKTVPKSEKGVVGEAVHYATGAALGLAYGAAAERIPLVTAGFGTAFGGSVALVLDEAAVPLLGLGPPPTETPPSLHLFGLASHLVFGLAAECTRRLVRRAL